MSSESGRVSLQEVSAAAPLRVTVLCGFVGAGKSRVLCEAGFSEEEWQSLISAAKFRNACWIRRDTRMVNGKVLLAYDDRIHPRRRESERLLPAG